MSDRPTPSHGESAERGSAPSFRIHRTDLIVSAVILAVCAFLLWDTTRFQEVPSSLAQNVQPTLFPRLIIAAIAIMALLLPLEHVQKQAQGIDLDSRRRSRPRPIVFITGAALLVVVAIMPWLGTFLGLVIAAAGLPFLWGERRYKILVPYVIVFPVAVTWFFVGVLEVNFLPGIVGYLFR